MPQDMKRHKNIFPEPIDFTILSMVNYSEMDDIQSLLANLKAKGWGNTSIAREIGVTVNAVEKWQSGDRSISQSRLILVNLLTNKKPPKRRRSSNAK